MHLQSNVSTCDQVLPALALDINSFILLVLGCVRTMGWLRLGNAGGWPWRASGGTNHDHDHVRHRQPTTHAQLAW